VQDAQHPRGEVVAAAERVAQLAEAARREAHRHRVDGEVAPRQVVVQARRLDDRQRARLGVALAARAGDVQHVLRHLDLRRPERLVHDHATTERRRQRTGERDAVPLDDEVGVVGRAPQEQVANRPADQVDARAGRRRHGRDRLARPRIGERADEVEPIGEVLGQAVAMTSISTSAPIGSSLTANAERAGNGSGMRAA
jgi:hypothetical protein